jgi:hypothetical protein
MALRLTLNKFPIDAKTKDKAGLPFGVVAQPFAREHLVVASDGASRLHAGKAENLSVEEVERCCECFAYCNRYCYFDYRSWACSLCGANNPIRKGSRYHNIPRRQKLPELTSSFIDVEYDEGEQQQQQHGGEREREGDEGTDLDYSELEEYGGGGKGEASEESSSPSSSPSSQAPAFIALVDTTGSEEQVEIAKNSVLAGLEALAPNALFGLATLSSDRVGLYDVRGKVPSVKYVPLFPEQSFEVDSRTTTGFLLRETLPLDWFAAEVERHKDAFSAAIESLVPCNSDSDSNSKRKKKSSSQFGPAVKALVTYLSGGDTNDEDEDETLMGSSSRSIPYFRLMSFVLTPPSHGSGRIDPTKRQQTGAAATTPTTSSNGNGGRTAKHQQKGNSVVSLSEDFYLKMGLHASFCGITCDLYIICESSKDDYFDLASIQCLSNKSGGRIFYYGSVETCNAPQDLHRTLSEPCAMNGTFRIRTTNEFKVDKSYGQLVEHHKYKNLYHVVACDTSTCFGFDFKFNSSGFSRDPEMAPTVQLAFQYSLFAPPDNNTEEEPLDSSSLHHPKAKKRCVMKRRLRIYTKQLAVAKSILDLYDYVDAEAVVAMLIHKCGNVIFDQGLAEARSLMEDWVINLMGEYNMHLRKQVGGDQAAIDGNGIGLHSTSPAEPDVAFRECKALARIPCFVYSMLRGEIFNQALMSANPDRWVYLFSACTSNPPKDIACAVYPDLSTYSENRIYRKNPLCRDLLRANEGHIYLVDSFFKIVVYYTKAALESGQPFPPPHSGIIRKEISDIRMSRGVTPLLVFIREGIDDERPLEDLLVEDPAKSGSGSPADYGFGPFLDVMKKEVQTFLEEY